MSSGLIAALVRGALIAPRTSVWLCRGGPPTHGAWRRLPLHGGAGGNGDDAGGGGSGGGGGGGGSGDGDDGGDAAVRAVAASRAARATATATATARSTRAAAAARRARAARAVPAVPMAGRAPPVPRACPALAGPRRCVRTLGRVGRARLARDRVCGARALPAGRELAGSVGGDHPAAAGAAGSIAALVRGALSAPRTSFPLRPDVIFLHFKFPPSR